MRKPEIVRSGQVRSGQVRSGCTSGISKTTSNCGSGSSTSIGKGAYQNRQESTLGGARLKPLLYCSPSLAHYKMSKYVLLERNHAAVFLVLGQIVVFLIQTDRRNPSPVVVISPR